MDIEMNDELRRRAAVHAALSDPARLAIVDTLALGDASPSELREALGMASNLLAHHLKVLESVGLLSRHRSEADRRRTYLRLAASAPGALVPTVGRPVRRVVFVCTHASARSQLAGSLWRRVSRVPAVAAGTHPAEHISPGAVDTARRHDLPLRRTRPQHLDDVRAAEDFVITVCDNAHEELGTLPDLHWSIPDPVRAGTPAAFDAALEDLDVRVRQLAPRLSRAS
jgi:ArsR family transcriptional regulator, arsenate/arsenite/antimonite-responsive transcriptional repressor / arsenate reductase (thioredoxin)